MIWKLCPILKQEDKTTTNDLETMPNPKARKQKNNDLDTMPNPKARNLNKQWFGQYAQS